MVASRIAVLGRGVVPPGEPVLRGDDLGVLRGDGLFETMHLRAGRPWLLGAHLARLRAGAAAVELPLPSDQVLVELLDAVAEGWPAPVEAALRLVCTRGPEGGGLPTVYATLGEVAPGSKRARRDGVTVATLPLGVPAATRPELAWLPAGVKSTSWGASSAARRWAARNDVADVLWVSSDGYALEGPSANVVWRDGDRLCAVPATTTGILPGTTAAWLLEHADAVGLTADERMVTPDGLRAADGVWFTSSVRGLVEVRALDGVALGPSAHTPALQELVGFPLP
ncbi:aminotransferase class IV [Micromonospora sp. NPDC000089]|uniref:aminotransferase class IV n=1 Tax=unclassified Micromonospora TaxID=2617518 RepID=UPI0036CCE216